MSRDWNFKSTIDTVSSFVLMAVAVSFLALYVQRATGATRPSGGPAAAGPLSAQAWKDALRTGIRIGADSAEFSIAAFVDFQCPYCRRMAATLDTILRENAATPGKVAVVIQHFPLSGHQFAKPSAIVAECAARVNRFAEMFTLLFEKQDSLGLKTWTSYAAEAGVRDTVAFARCSRLPVDSFPRINTGLDLGRRNNVRATPTIWIEGRQFAGAIDLETLRGRMARAGKRN